MAYFCVREIPFCWPQEQTYRSHIGGQVEKRAVKLARVLLEEEAALHV
jgi:hypothetical protein